MQGGRRPPGPQTIELVRCDHDDGVPAADCHTLRLASRGQADDFAESRLRFRQLPAEPSRIRTLAIARHDHLGQNRRDGEALQAQARRTAEARRAESAVNSLGPQPARDRQGAPATSGAASRGRARRLSRTFPWWAAIRQETRSASRDQLSCATLGACCAATEPSTAAPVPGEAAGLGIGSVRPSDCRCIRNPRGSRRRPVTPGARGPAAQRGPEPAVPAGPAVAAPGRAGRCGPGRVDPPGGPH